MNVRETTALKMFNGLHLGRKLMASASMWRRDYTPESWTAYRELAATITWDQGAQSGRDIFQLGHRSIDGQAVEVFFLHRDNDGVAIWRLGVAVETVLEELCEGMRLNYR